MTETFRLPVFAMEQWITRQAIENVRGDIDLIDMAEREIERRVERMAENETGRAMQCRLWTRDYLRINPMYNPDGAPPLDPRFYLPATSHDYSVIRVEGRTG